MAEYKIDDLAGFYRNRLGQVATPYPSFLIKNGYQFGSGTSLLTKEPEFTDQAPVANTASFKDLERPVVVPEITNYLGLTTIMPLKIKLRSEKNWWELPVEPLVRIQGSKNILKTPVAGLDGEVKELISNKDYRLTIVGVLISEEEEVLPVEDLRKLKRYIQAKESIQIQQDLLNLWGINEIVIEDHELPEMEGKPGEQLYKIMALSDRHFELKLKKGYYEVD